MSATAIHTPHRSSLRIPVGAALACAAAFVLSGCGGGGSGGGTGGAPATGAAALHGSVVLRNGTTANLGGVRITDPRTGRTVFTASDGSFDFGTVPAGTITLKVFDPLAATALVSALSEDDGGDDSGGGTSGSGTGTGTDDSGTDDSGTTGTSGTDDSGTETESETESETEVEQEDAEDDIGDDADDDAADDGDDNDTGDDDMDVSGVDDGENVEIRIGVNGGKIESVDVSHSSSDDREAEIHLTRSSASDDLDAEGEAKIESRTDRERFEVKAEHLDAGRVLELFVITPDGTEESQGTQTVGLDGEARWRADTSNGDALPFGVATVADLEGHDVEVRDATAGTLLLFGTLPSVPTSVDDETETEAEGRALLVAEAGVTGEAHVEVKSRTGDEAREEFKVEVEGRAPAGVVDVLVEDPANLGTMVSVGTLVIGGEGEGDLEFDSHHGDALPFGVANVSALVGLLVELRDGGTNALLFSGTVPALVQED